MTSSQPIFQAIFNEQWANLPAVIHKHYANRPFTSDRVTVEGVMKVELSLITKIISPLMRLTKLMPAYAGDNIPVTVYFDSKPDSSAYHFNRIFNFPGKGPYHFKSYMLPIGGNEVVDFMPVNIGWHAAFEYDGRRILMKHRGYKMRLRGKIITIPLEFLFGKGYAEEEALDENNFRMYLEIRHFLFGKIYAYSGQFKVIEVKLNG